MNAHPDWLVGSCGMTVTRDVLNLKLSQGNKPILGVDIDDTLSQTNKYWFEYVRRNFGLENGHTLRGVMQRHQRVQDYPYWQENPEAQDRISKAVGDPEFYERTEVIHGSQEGLEYLAQSFDIVYISARPISIQGTTRDWLNANDFPQGEIIHRPESYSIDSLNLWKAQVLNFLSPRVVGIIDDNPGLAPELHELKYSGRVVIFGQEKHHLRDNENYFCTPSWNDVKKLFPKCPIGSIETRN